MTIQRIFTLFIVAFLYACTPQIVKQEKSEDKTAKPENAGYILLFTEMRPQEPESTVRMIITDQFLRIDEGPESEDFILFNRQNKTIFNVVKDDQSILVINPGEQNIKPPFPIRWIIESQTSQAMMRTDEADKAAATHYLFYLNEEPCYNEVTIDNHLVETVDAMREYNEVLANELKRNYHMMEGQQCYEAINIFDPNIRLQYGFPLREWSKNGYQRFLVNYKQNIVFPVSMFTLPENFKKIEF